MQLTDSAGPFRYINFEYYIYFLMFVIYISMKKKEFFRLLRHSADDDVT